ncbi:prephenate dehydrogenase [Sinobacterium caligoides]|uniref:prephenate dehydrogenase n=1 Tax=Sinobacterium caligoides TaxID=933926 RepID=A0A3N2DZ86_9GAMM|nr:prephenate dehydrogenase/arogenate dehydrogenase family protein [Sinobacterium caligoides]ROS05134.1 prephenate dehydrogenase [Sinobacterium caligoides]
MIINKLVVLGAGLIGGSLAKACRQRGLAAEVVGWGRKEANLQKAIDFGVIDRYELDLAEAVKDADVIFIATPTLVAESMLERLAVVADSRSIITDGASVKGNLYRAAQRIYGQVPSTLVLGHPIAGSEESGVEAANAELYVNHRVILTPTAETSSEAEAVVRELWQGCGAEVVSMDVERHDRVLAATSHLPHVLAYSLVDSLAQQDCSYEIFDNAAGGFRDFTRIAASDPQMWHDIVLANKAAVLSMMDDFTDQLKLLRENIASDNGDEIMASFQRAREARRHFSSILQKRQQKKL